MAGVRDNDKGWKAIREALGDVKDAYTQVGVQEGETRSGGPDDEETDMVTIAAANEFGTRDGHIPERPFMRSAFDGNLVEIDRRKRAAAQAIIDGGNAKTELGKIGAWFQGVVQQTIVDLREPPNAPSTIARKGSTNPLINTGQMRQSIRHIEKLK